MSTRTRARRSALRIVIATLVVSSLPGTAAQAAGAQQAHPGLSGNVDGSGSGATVKLVDTSGVRAQVPRAAIAPRILLIGTGVARGLFPAALQPSIVAPTAADGLDSHGFGTLAASVIFQVLPKAVVQSYAVPARDAAYTEIQMDKLADALRFARAERSRFDAVLLAFPPQAALDPISHVTGRVSYGEAFGTGLAMVVEGMVANAGRTTDGPVVGIPSDRGLRERMFAGANTKQRDAIEQYAKQALAWGRVTDALEALTAAGVAVIAPTPDMTRTQNGSIVPLPTQTIYGLSAHPDVITVGAAYSDGLRMRVSPTSGRGPTLDLLPKPDLLAPASVLGMLPGGASLGWRDDSMRVPLARLDWAASGVAPTPCPSLTSVYRCVLQASPMVSAALVTANLASLVADGVPRRAADRRPADASVLRGIAVVEASRVQASASDEQRDAHPWEQGAGILAGLRTFDPARTPVPVGPADLGTIGWDERANLRVPLWGGGARAADASAAIGSFLGAEPSGRAIALPHHDPSRVAAGRESDAVTLTARRARAQGGVYAGRLTLTSPAGDTISLPLQFVQGIDVDFKVTYAYNEFQTGGPEGERVEKATAVLFAGAPTNVGLVGEAFKNFGGEFHRIGGDPTNGPIIRSATTRDSFDDPSVAPADHGRGTLRAVPPGFYKIHFVSDHTVEARQARGHVESIGMHLATSGPGAVIAPAADILIPSEAPCPGGAAGPLGGCVQRDGDVDPSSGLCRARNDNTRVSFSFYCGEISYAVPGSIVTRAVHHVQHHDDPARSEWDVCNVRLPLDGSQLDLARIVERADRCDEGALGSSWTVGTRAPGCLGSSERARFPNGHPEDVRASLRTLVPPGAPGSALPAAVLTYEFALPYLNTYTTAAMAFSYTAENAIVGVRFQTGDRATDDASHGLLVLDDPGVDVRPALERSSSRGSIFNEWSLMSANASVAQVSLIIIPTAWASTGLDPRQPVANVELCNVSLRVTTFAKQTWGQPVIEDGTPVQFFPVLDRGIHQQIDPRVERTRAIWDDHRGRFVDVGSEPETLHAIVQIPKNTTLDRSAPHHVRSPVGGPAHFLNARRWGTDARRHEPIVAADHPGYDPGYGLTHLTCSEGPAQIEPGHLPHEIAAWEICKAWKTEVANNETLAGLFHESWANGRFHGLLAVDHAAIARAAGNVAFESAAADDGGAFESRWATNGDRYVRHVPIPDFYDETVGNLSVQLLGGAVTIRKDGNNNHVLTVNAGAPGGRSYTISTTL